MRKKRANSRLRKDQLRRAQSVVPFGVGSIIDLPHESLMPVSINQWHENFGHHIYDGRLQRRLGVSHFRMVPSGEESSNQGVPATRFPKWLFCPRCRYLKRVDDWYSRYITKHKQTWDTPRCCVCSARLVPSRFVMVCWRGHIDDFPYVSWVHQGEMCTRPDLTIRADGGSFRSSAIRVECQTCGARRSMGGALTDNAKFFCTGFMPWQGRKEDCNERVRVLLRGASNIYFPQVVTSILIPSKDDAVLERLQSAREWPLLIEGDHPEPLISYLLEKLAEETGISRERILDLVKNQKIGPPMPVDEEEYRFTEYEAFMGRVPHDLPPKDLSLEVISGKGYGIPALKSVTLIHRLREVRVLVAFSRLQPLDRGETHPEDDRSVLSKAVPVHGKKRLDWLPGAEVRGEGIFLQFDKGMLKNWDKHPMVKERAAVLNHRHGKLAEERGLSPREISPQFLFLHTFSHLLIRQLAFECGYGSASLKERIYCSDDPFMAGILIYTASGDAEGTLGGLVRQGKSDLLPDLIAKTLRSAYWCSSDPLCIESKGQGLASLNLAACHACALLPETCCEEFNRLLDRASVVGLPRNPDVGFLSQLMHF